MKSLIQNGGLKLSLVAGIPLVAIGALSNAPSAKAYTLSQVVNAGYTISIGDPNACTANNAIDFKTTSINDPCSTNQWGTLGNGSVVGASLISDATQDPLGVFGTPVEQMDLILPGVRLFYNLTPTPVLDPGGSDITITNFVRFDSQGPSGIGAGDFTFSITSATTSAPSTGFFEFNMTGFFQEIGAIAAGTYGTRNENITLVGPKYAATLSLLSGTSAVDLNNLALVGTIPGGAGTCSIQDIAALGSNPDGIPPIENLTQGGACSTAFGGVPTSATGKFRLTQPNKEFIVKTAPEPSNVAGLIAAGSVAAVTFVKRKKRD